MGCDSRDSIWAFTGRDEELERLLDLLAGQRSRGIVLAGSPGVGKTRLAMEFLARAADRPKIVTTHITASRSTTQVPLGAVATLLPADAYPESQAESRARMLRTAAAALVRDVGDRRLVVLVDDAHLLDDTSATLIYQLAASNAVFVVATVRSFERAPAAVVGLWKDDLLERMDVRELSTDAIERLLCAQLGGQVDSFVINRLSNHCRGNVLFLRELVAGAVRDGSLVDEAGLWRLVGPLHPSDRLVELVEARLADLSEEERAVLELVCWGEPLEVEELASLVDLDQAEVLERRGFLATVWQECGRREVRPAHPVYGDVVRARTSALRAFRLANTLADTIERRGLHHPRDVLRAATWRLEGGGGKPEVLLAAAQTARWSYDFPLAARLVERAVAVGGGFDAALLAAQVATWRGYIAEGQEQLAVLAGQAKNDLQKALVALTQLDSYAFHSGAIDKGLAIADLAERTIQDQDWKDEIRSHRAGLVLARYGPMQAEQLVEPLLRLSNDRALVWTCLAATTVFSRMGRFKSAIETAERGYSVARSLPRPTEWYPWVHTFTRCLALMLSGSFLEAEQLAKTEHAAALEEGSVEAQAWFSWGVTRVLRERGNVDCSIRYGREAVALFRELNRPISVREALADLAFALAMAGRAQDARDALDSAHRLAMPPTYLTGVDLHIASAWVAVAEGNLGDARNQFLEAAEVGDRIGDFVCVANALHALVRLGPANMDHVRKLEHLATVIEGDLIQGRLLHARGLALSDADQLESASALFESLGAKLLAAEAAADAANTSRLQEQRRRAAADEFRCAGLLNQCDSAVLLLHRINAIRDTLTRAEQEAALLAAAGRSNQSIADDLCLSVRTVEGRLQRVYAKLGVTNRTQLRSKLAATTTTESIA